MVNINTYPTNIMSSKKAIPLSITRTIHGRQLHVVFIANVIAVRGCIVLRNIILLYSEGTASWRTDRRSYFKGLYAHVSISSLFPPTGFRQHP